MTKCITEENNKYDLEVFECTCGFHMGIDASYLEQFGDIEMDCPACSASITTKE